MRKLRIWIAEDELHRPIELALKSALGPNGTYALYEVFPDPVEFVSKCETAQVADDLPDVALIDVNFKTRSVAVGPMAEVEEQSRGFIVAAELKYHASRLHKENWIYQIYTGNKQVRDNFQWLYRNPYGHEPLLRIVEKSAIAGPFQFIDWLRARCHALVRTRLRNSEFDMSNLSHFVDDLKLSIQSHWSVEWNSYLEDFRRTVRPIVDALIDDFQETIDADPDFAKTNYLPIERLKAAQTTGAVRYALSLCEGEKVEILSQKLDQTTTAFKRKHRVLIIETTELILEKVKEFRQTSKFANCIGPLFPFEAWEIGHSADPETVATALRTVLDLIGESVDHNYTLARAFKYFKMPGRTDYMPTTVFASACHGWDKKYWFYNFPMPDGNDGKEQLLREELPRLKSFDETPASSSSSSLPILKLPEDTLSRIYDDGRNAVGGLDSPHVLLEFASSDKAEWIKRPVELLREKFGNVNVVLNPESYKSKSEVLTDWRRFFAKNDDSNSGLIDRIMAEGKMKGVKTAEVSYHDEDRKVWITLDFDVENYFGQIDLQKPGGGLTSALKEFLGWGQLNIFTNNEHVYFRTTWPGGASKTYSSGTGQPQFKLQWAIPHYLETRGTL